MYHFKSRINSSKVQIAEQQTSRKNRALHVVQLAEQQIS